MTACVKVGVFDYYAYQSDVWRVVECMSFGHVLVEESAIVVSYYLIENRVFGLICLDEHFALFGSAT